MSNSSCPDDDVVSETTFFNRFFGGVLLTVGVLVPGFLLVTFIKRSVWCILIRKRNPWLVMIGVFGCFLQLLFPIRELYGRDTFPCWIYVNLPMVILVLQAAPFLARIVLFYYKIRLNQKLADNLYRDAVQDAISVQAQMLLAEENDESEGTLNPKKITENLSSDKDNSNSTSLATSKTRSNSELEREFDVDLTSSQSSSAKRRYDAQLKKLEIISSPKFGGFIFLLAFVPGCLFMILRVVSLWSCVGCDFEVDALYDVFTIAVILVTVAFVFLYKVWQEPDPLLIKHELFIEAGVAAFFSIFFIIKAVDPGDVEKDGKWSWSYHWTAGSIWLMIFGLGFPVFLSRREEKTRLKIAPSDEDIKLNEVLSSKIGRSLFKTHLIAELSIENYLFHNDVTKWKEEVRKLKKTEGSNHGVSRSRESRAFKFTTFSMNSETGLKGKKHKVLVPTEACLLKAKAMIIEKYVLRTSPFEVNISHQARQSVLAIKESVELNENDFDEALKEVRYLLEYHSLPRFIRTEYYYAFRIQREGENQRNIINPFQQGSFNEISL